ncbi:hypothetical protein [Serratia sp. (in: enterobacteria)]|uniref:hypothetical protein n=1 Tax=Serratia sp. (in: enterobacteria) TaxID=616 RepID=UPI00398A0C01
MKYYLANKIESSYYTVLIDTDLLYNSLQKSDDVDRLISELSDEPRSEWIVKGEALNIFYIPLIKINGNEEIKVVDGRHRICWMKLKGMTEIPIAISEDNMNCLIAKGINYTAIINFEMPCNVIPKPLQQDIPNGYELVKKLVSRAKVIKN